MYTHEPDICHEMLEMLEMLGHVPMFANQYFANASKAIGKASIGASDAEIERLSRIYWYSVEFGLCYEKDQRKVFGAGILSSVDEIMHCMSNDPNILDWNPSVPGSLEYPITTVQPTYFIGQSFKNAMDKTLEFQASLNKEYISPNV